MPYPNTDKTLDVRCTHCGHNCGYADIQILRAEGVGCPADPRGNHKFVEVIHLDQYA